MTEKGAFKLHIMRVPFAGCYQQKRRVFYYAGKVRN